MAMVMPSGGDGDGDVRWWWRWVVMLVGGGGSLGLGVGPGVGHEAALASSQVLLALVAHAFQEVAFVAADVLHSQERSVGAALPDPHAHCRPHWALPHQIAFQPFLEPGHHSCPAHHDHVGEERLRGGGGEGREEGDDELDEVELVVADDEGLEVDLVGADEVGEEEELVGLLEVVVVLGLRPLGVDLAQLGLHGLELAVVVGLLGVAVGEPVVLAELLVGVVVLLCDACDGLHFALFEFALAVAEFVADAFVLLDAFCMCAVLLLELFEVEFWVVFAQVAHACVLLFAVGLFLAARLERLLLVELELLVLELLGREVVVGDVDEGELVVLAALLRQPQLHLQRVDLLRQLVVRVVVPEDLGHLLVRELVVGLVALLEVQAALQLRLVQSPLHLLPPRQRLLQLLRHPPPHLLLTPDLLLGHLHQRVKVDLHALDEPQLLLDGPIGLLDAVAVDGAVGLGLELALEVAQLSAVVDGDAGEALIDLPEEAVAEAVLELGVLEQDGPSEQLEGVVAAQVEPPQRAEVHPAAHHGHGVHGGRAHADHEGSLALVAGDIAVHLVEVGEERVHTDHHAVNLVALEELLQEGVAAVCGVGEGFGDDEGGAQAAVGADEFAEQVVVALLEEGEVEDEVALVGALVVAARELHLVVAGVHEALDRQVRLARVAVLRDLRAEHQLGCWAGVVPRLDVLGAVVDHQRAAALAQRLHLPPPRRRHLPQRRRSPLHLRRQVLARLYLHSPY